MSPRARRIGTALFLAAVIIAFRAIAPMPSDGWLFLLIAPIALIAVEFAFTGGLVAGVLASFVAVLFKVSGVMAYSYMGLAVRITTFLIAGAGVGYLIEQRNRHEAKLRRLELREYAHREGLELNDDVVQGLAVAKMALEMEDAERARATLDVTLKRAQEIASTRLAEGGPLVRSEEADPTPPD